jgi:hypothetical protein
LEQGAIAAIEWSETHRAWVFHTLYTPDGLKSRKPVASEFEQKQAKVSPDEKAMERALEAELVALGWQTRHQVRCAAGIIDILTPGHIYELKSTLDRGDLMQALGQVMGYHMSLDDGRKPVIVGRVDEYAEGLAGRIAERGVLVVRAELTDDGWTFSGLPTLPTADEIEPANGFNYATLDMESRIVVRQRTDEIRTLLRRTAQDIVDIGGKLADVKARLGHGQFGAWLEQEFQWQERTARNFMAVHDRFKTANFADLAIAPSALYLLASPSVAEETTQAVIQRAQAGEHITYTAAKEAINTAQIGQRATPEPVNGTGEVAAAIGAQLVEAGYRYDAETNAYIPTPESIANAERARTVDTATGEIVDVADPVTALASAAEWCDAQVLMNADGLLCGVVLKVGSQTFQAFYLPRPERHWDRFATHQQAVAFLEGKVR